MNKRSVYTPTHRLTDSRYEDIDELGGKHIDEQEEERRNLHAELIRLTRLEFGGCMRYPTTIPSHLAGDATPKSTTGLLCFFQTAPKKAWGSSTITITNTNNMTTSSRLYLNDN